VTVQSVGRRTRVRAIAIAALALLAGSSFSARRLSARDLFDELYERGQKQNANLKTLTASFTETSTSALLAKPLVEHGTVVVERPSRVALRYTDPSPRVVLIDGDRMTVSWPSAGIRNTTDVGATQKRIQKYFVDNSASELRSHFQISAREAVDRPGTYHVTMVPKRKQIQEALTRLELWVDRASLLLTAMRMSFAGGESKLMTFEDVKPNAPIEPGAFRVE
jgi:outer membrane lipoprotein-sorting protein